MSAAAEYTLIGVFVIAMLAIIILKLRSDVKNALSGDILEHNNHGHKD